MSQRPNSAPLVDREVRIADRVVFVGGQPGCGKTMLTPIIGSLDRVEIQKFNYPIEHICTLHYLGKISDDVAATMVRMLADLDLYNLMMSREVNFRPSDLSSVFRNAKPWRYFRRAFQAGDEAVMPRIRDGRPVLNLVMHDLLMRSKALFLGLGDRMTLVELVRHPLYMIKQWMKNVEQFYDDKTGDRDYPRDFSLRIQDGSKLIPWWALGIEDAYHLKNPMDKTIYAIKHHREKSDEAYKGLSTEERTRVVRVSFEKFVLDPMPDLKHIAAALGTAIGGATLRAMKKQNVPRRMIADGIALPIYKRYGWVPPQKGSTERQELESRRAWAAKQASPQALEILDRISAEYEANYMKEILDGRS